MFADYHLHTKRCRHASGEMNSYVEEASAKEFEEIGFADHAPADEGFDPRHRMTWDQFHGYVSEIEKLRSQFPSMTIRLGIEVDLHPHFEPLLERLRKEYPVEYVIGSVHFVDDFFVFTTDPVTLPAEDEDRLIRRYFELIEQGVRSGLIDVVGHLDMIKWPLPHAKEKLLTEGKKTLEQIAQTGVAIELNTSGLRKHPGEMYPCEDFLRFARTLEMPICLGSDAHRPTEVGADFDKALDLLGRMSYRREVVMKNGLRAFQPI